MGREIRMVPPNWQHPPLAREHDTYGHGGYQPMFDETFAEAAAEWKAEFAKWEAGERPDYCSDESKGLEFWEYHGAPPIRDYYRTYDKADATWLQVYETVSEGTPVSPPFATPEELIDYLATHGDFWDQKRGDPAWSRASAEAFVKRGFAPSLIVQNNQVIASKDAALALSEGSA